MPEPTSIVAMIAAIKHSIDVVKAVKDADYDLDKSILKEKIAILVDSLLEAKIQAIEIQEVVQEKEKRIKELEEAFKLKAKLKYKDFAYFEVNKNDEIISDTPFCPYCWEQKQKVLRLTRPHSHSAFIICPECKNSFSRV